MGEWSQFAHRVVHNLLITSILGLALILPSLPSARAQIVSDPVIQEEIKLARDTAINAGSAVLTKGESVRGATGPLVEFLKNSDSLICQSWLIAFNLRLRNLMLEGGDPELIAKAQDLQWKVERACQPILEGTPGTTAGGIGGGTVTEPPATPQPAGAPFVPREGWTIADEICYRKCAGERAAYEKAIADLQRAEQRQQQAQADVDRQRANLADLQRQIASAEANLAAANAGLKKTHTGSLTAAQERELVSFGNQKSGAENSLRLLRPKLPEARAALERAESVLRSRTSDTAEARQALERARMAYEDCMRRCKSAADHAAGQPSPTGIPAQGGPKCASVPSAPVNVGPQKDVGAGFAKTVSDTARSIVGNPLSRLGGGSVGFGSGGREASRANRPSASDGPKLAADPVPAKQTFTDPRTGAKILVGGRMTDKGLAISTEVADVPSKGTFQTIYLENDDCQRMRPAGYVLWKLWEEWTLTVHWTRDRYVDGQHVSHEEGGWKESGRRDLASGVIPIEEAEQNPIWKRFGFDRATEGIKGLGTEFAATREMLAAKATKLVIQVTNPGIDPVSTIPFDLRVTPNTDGSLSFAPL